MKKEEFSLLASPSQGKLEDPRYKSPTLALSPQGHELGEKASTYYHKIASDQPLMKP
jgi:hypothetical protein